MTNDLRHVERATQRRVTANKAWRDAIRAAIRAGHSQRKVAERAGITHTRVQQVLRGE